jgi:hypothetical protein
MVFCCRRLGVARESSLCLCCFKKCVIVEMSVTLMHLYMYTFCVSLKLDEPEDDPLWLKRVTEMLRIVSF